MNRTWVLTIIIAICGHVVTAKNQTWVRVGNTSQIWSPRCSFGATTADGNILIVGGGSTKCLSDVWSSQTDKIGSLRWNLQTNSIGWSEPRTAFPAVTIEADSTIVILGGCNGPYQRFNDVYASRDGGYSWTLQTSSAAWSARCCHAAVTLGNGTILILGGHDMVDAPSGPGGYRNDVWKSDDKGVSWSMVNNRSAWSPRDAHAVVRLSDDTIILTGGHDGANDPSQWHHDVWESRDGGSSWKVMTRTAEWSPRSAHAVTTFDDSLFLMGGWGDSGLLNDVWYSRTGGSSWEFIGTAPWEARWWFSAVTSGSDIVVLGGINEQGDDLGDVWSLSVAKNETKSQTVFSLIPAARSREDATNNVIGDLLCLEGTHDDVESALHELRSSPVAALYEASVVTPSSCFDRGFISEASASDQCFPTLGLHYRPLTLPNYPGVPQTDRANLYQYRSIVDGVLIGHDYNMKQKNGTSTICRRNVTLPPAIDMLPRRDEIPRSAFDSGVGSHVPDAGLLCNEGPLTGNYTIYDMVRTLKNGSLASIQQLDGVQAGTPCHSRGFVVSQGKSDHCYPPAVMWYTGNIFDLYKAEWLEQGAMLSYDHDFQSPGEGERIATCDCRPGSEVRASLPKGYCSD